MNRVSTFGGMQSALLDLMGSQSRMDDAQKRVSTKKNATDLVGFGRTSENVTALKSMTNRVQTFIDASEATEARLISQDMAFERVADGAQAARQAIADALAADKLDGLMDKLAAEFSNITEGLNTKHQGRYLFSGGDVDRAPVPPVTMNDLAAAPDVDGAFVNGSVKQVSRLDEGTRLETGFLANDVGTELFDLFRDIQQFNAGTPLTGRPDDAMRDFLTQQLALFDTARENVIETQASNGVMQARVETILTSHKDRQVSLEAILSKKTDADMVRAVTDLDLAKIAVQASAQVINTLRDASLLNYLR